MLFKSKAKTAIPQSLLQFLAIEHKNPDPAEG